MKCAYRDCDVEVEFLLGTIDDGEVRFAMCPNHQVLYGIEGRTDKLTITDNTSLAKAIGDCHLCSAPAWQFVDAGETEFHLCEPHLRKLFLRHLSPSEFKILYKKFGNVFLLHDDFYDPETGEAFQPVR